MVPSRRLDAELDEEGPAAALPAPKVHSCRVWGQALASM